MSTRRIKFSGFATASAVTIAATLASGQSANESTGPGGWGVAVAGGAATAEIVVARRNPGKFAPDGIIFEVANLQGFDTPVEHAPTNNLYKPQRHGIEVFWDFGDEGSVYSAPVKVLDEWKNRNVAKGHRAAHVYRNPGIYTITAFLVEMSSGKTATAYLTLSGADAVLDPDDVFPGSATIYVNSAENYANAPSGAATFPSMGAAASASALAGWTRVMMASGHEEICTSPRGANNFVCAEPAAAVRPKMIASGAEIFKPGRTSNAEDFLIVQGIEMQGEWDAVTQTGTQRFLFSISAPDGSSFQRGYYMVDDVYAHGAGDLFSSTGAGSVWSNMTSCAQIAHDCHFTSWGNFGTYFSGPEFGALLGCKIAQHVDALSGGGKVTPARFNMHGPHRAAAVGKFVIDGCDLFSKNGWSAISGYQVYQPCLRPNTDCRNGAEYDIARCAMEGGLSVIEIKYAKTETLNPAGFANSIVIDSNVITTSHQSILAPIEDRFGGLTVRNNVIVLADVPVLASIYNPVGAIQLYCAHAAGEPGRNAPIEVYQNTYINLLSAGNDLRSGSGIRPLIYYVNNNFSEVYEGNNVIHQPNATTQVLTYAPLDDTPLFAPRTNGYRDTNNTGGALWDQYATPADAVWSGKPVNDPDGRGVSDAIGGALTGLTSYSDIRMQPRPIFPSVGAWEPAA